MAESEYGDAPRANHLRRPSELLDMPRECPFLVEKIVPAMGIGVFYGVTGVGKTACLLFLAVCVAAGLDFFGYKVTRSPVLYLIGEGLAGLPQRFFAILEHLGIPEDALDDWICFRVVPTDLSDFQVQADLSREIYEKGTQLPKLIISDTYSANAGAGFNENATDHAKGIGDGARAMARQLNAMIMFAHHPGKADEKGPRGSNDVIGSADVVIKFSKQGDVARGLQVEKGRDFAPPPLLKLAMREKFGGIVLEQLHGMDVALQPSHKVMLNALADASVRFNTTEVRSTDWMKESLMSKSQFHVVKGELLKGQYVEDGRNGYTLTELGKQAIGIRGVSTSPIGSPDYHRTSGPVLESSPVSPPVFRPGHRTYGTTTELQDDGTSGGRPPDHRTSEAEQLQPIDEDWWNSVRQDSAA